MNTTHPKILEIHLKRLAVIYIRQSSPLQVENHLESKARLARNSLDWYQLLELAAGFDVLIADEDGVYNPAEFNDRLLLGFVGPREEAEQIKQRFRTFLQEELKLELSEAKTLITHAKTETARFLNYEIHPIQEDSQRDQRDRRSHNGNIELFQAEYRGLVEYYRLAYNLHRLTTLEGVMEQSLTKRLSAKHKLSVPKVYRKYQAVFREGKKCYKVLQTVIEREGKKPLVARWAGISLHWDSKAPIKEYRTFLGPGRSELEKRLLTDTCEYCGTTGDADLIEVHVRRFGGRDRAHRTVRELMEGSLYTPLTLPSKEEGDQSMWGRPCREKSLIF